MPVALSVHALKELKPLVLFGNNILNRTCRQCSKPALHISSPWLSAILTNDTMRIVSHNWRAPNTGFIQDRTRNNPTYLDTLVMYACCHHCIILDCNRNYPLHYQSTPYQDPLQKEVSQLLVVLQLSMVTEVVSTIFKKYLLKLTEVNSVLWTVVVVLVPIVATLFVVWISLPLIKE